MARFRFTLMAVTVCAALLVAALMPGRIVTAFAAARSPFIGHWQATDVDGSDIRLSLGGPPGGPFQITWTEDAISFCNGGAGIVRGMGLLNGSDENVFGADLHLECLTTGASLDFYLTFRYHPATGTLSARYDNGNVVIWHRPGQLPPAPPALSLRVNYGHDWVESFYEAGHIVWVTVTESDGTTVKATAELVTEPKDFWGGETGFQTWPEVWNPSPPDILPGDWVYGWVDNGASAQVQIGDISGAIDLAEDSITGTILAPWIGEPVPVECLDWGSGGEPFANKDGGTVLPNGAEQYACSWAGEGEWDIQPYQNVGVGYFGTDGHWVANAFFARNARIVASAAGDWFWTVEFNQGTLNLFIYASVEEGAELLWQGSAEADASGFAIVGSGEHGLNLVPGHYLVVSDGPNTKELVLEPISMEVFDTASEIMAGTAPAGREVLAVAGMAEAETQAHITVMADPISGGWTADFTTVPFDITEDMRPWSFAQIFDEDGDANEAGTPPPPPAPVINALPWDGFVEGIGWPIGSVASLVIGDFAQPASVEPAPWDPSVGYVRFDLRAAGYTLKTGDLIVLSGDGATKELLVSVEVTDVNLDHHTISGVSDPALDLSIGVGDQVPTGVAFDGNTWVATFSELAPGAWGGVDQPDADGDNTHITFRTPSPVIVAHPAYEFVGGHEWAPGAEVTLAIDDPANGEGVDYTQTAVASGPINYFFDTRVQFPLAGFDLQAGHQLTMSDGRYTQTMVVGALRVTGFYLDTHTVFGVGDPGSEFVVADNGVNVLVDGSGNWSASFDNLLPNSWWTILQAYPDGNEMRETFRVPAPVIDAHPAYEFVGGHEWTPGATVTLTIDDPANGDGVDYTQTAIASDEINYLYDTRVDLNLSGYDLKAGDRLTMSDGHYSQTMVVSALRVTGFDLATHTVSGVGDPNSTVWFVNNGVAVLVDANGNWSASFDALLPGTWWTVIQTYADGNQTVETFHVPA